VNLSELNFSDRRGAFRCRWRRKLRRAGNAKNILDTGKVNISSFQRARRTSGAFSGTHNLASQVMAETLSEIMKEENRFSSAFFALLR
jgi:hypothetical protein